MQNDAKGISLLPTKAREWDCYSQVNLETEHNAEELHKLMCD